MSGVTAGTVLAAAAVAGTAYSIYNGEQQAAQAKKAQRQAQENANKQLSQAQQDINRANQKRPDTMAIMDSVEQAGKQGVSSTMLTGSQGVDQTALSLGKNTLLGQ